jgi:peroxiredoxin
VELPRLQTLYEEYADRGFEVVAVDSFRDTARATKFIEEKGLTYTLLENGENDAAIVAEVFKVYAYPSSFLIDRDGRVQYFHLGFELGDEKKMAKEIESLL